MKCTVKHTFLNVRAARATAALAATLAATILAAGCVMNRVSAAPETIILVATSSGRPITLTVDAGAEYATRMQMGPFVFNVLPQFALWMEDGDGQFLETLYVTGADGKGMRNAEKNKLQAAFYAKYLPVWSARASAAGRQLPSKESPYPDAITSATPTTSFTLQTAVPATLAARLEVPTAGQQTAGQERGVVFFLEVNRPGDFNAVFTAEATDGVGQPSLLYQARGDARWLSTNGAAATAVDPIEMRVVGHGGMAGQAPAVYSDLSGIDTAMQLISRLTLQVGE